MFKEIFRSFKKSKNIKRITKEYLKYSNSLQSISDFAKGIRDTVYYEKKEKIINEIIDLSLTEPNNRPVIKKFNLDKEKIKKIFEDLEYIGLAGQFAGAHYISISSILYPQTLEFIAYKERNEEMEKYDMINRLSDYFKNGETGNIVEIDY
ncbi:hypothetical protein N9E72_01360 [Candidatus Pelagibacter sp.]|jgi:hypothetical protein|nr:hypothetical protein [Candidatus Pelagibacter sp.]